MLAVVAGVGNCAVSAPAVLDFGMGSRALALGEAAVSLSSGESSLYYNPAGIAWAAPSASSSYEIRSDLGHYWDIGAVLGRAGIAVQCFDFGRVPLTDDFGNVIGSYSYRDYDVRLGLAMRASEMPLLAGSWSDLVAIGLVGKILKVETLSAGGGASADLGFLCRSDHPLARVPGITSLALGLQFANVLSTPIAYESGLQENWQRYAVLGCSVETVYGVLVTASATSRGMGGLGIEWRPVPPLALRFGVKSSGVLIGSAGVGISLKRLSIDLTVVMHPYLPGQIRASLGASW